MVPSVGIYVRLSDKDKSRLSNDDSQSIANQKSLLNKYCEDHNWHIYDIYCDDGFSGTDNNRPEFNRIIKDCKNGLIDIVLCKDLSRFSRDIAIVDKYVTNLFPEWNVRFIGVADNSDTENDDFAPMRLFSSAFNEMYVQDISRKIRGTLNHKRQNGEFVGSFAPYGYAIDPDNKNHLIIDPETAPIVREIFKMYSNGKSYRAIVIELNDRNIPSPSKYKQLSGSNFVSKNCQNSHCNGLWTLSTITKILHDEMYTGTLVQGKSHKISYKNKKRKRVPSEDWIRVPNTHEAIISKEMWQSVQERKQSKQRVKKKTQELSPLSGKVKCAVCGKPMKRGIYYNKAQTKQYYNLQCGTYKVGAMNCTNKKCISGLQLEKTILSQLNDLIYSYCDTDSITIADTNEEHKQKLIQQSNRLENDKKRYENRLINLYTDKLDGIITAEQYESFKNGFESELQKINSDYTEIRNSLKRYEEIQQSDNRRKALIEKYRCITDLTKPIADEFIDTIYIGEINDNNEREITINWRI